MEVSGVDARRRKRPSRTRSSPVAGERRERLSGYRGHQNWLEQRGVVFGGVYYVGSRWTVSGEKAGTQIATYSAPPSAGDE